MKPPPMHEKNRFESRTFFLYLLNFGSVSISATI